APMGQMQDGGWRMGSDNEVIGIGDVDGDHRDDFVLWSPWGMGVLHGGDWFSGGTPFKTLTAFAWGDLVDGKAFVGTAPRDRMVGDFDGDGRADIAMIDRNDHRLVLFAYDLTSKRLVRRASLRPGEVASGGWRWGTADLPL